MTLDEIFRKFEEKTGMSPLTFSPDGVITFIFNGSYKANFEKSEGDALLTLYGTIGELPYSDREASLIWLLEANLFGRETKGASLGLDRDTKEVILFKTFTVEKLEFDPFFEDVNSILEAQVALTESLKEGKFQRR